MTQTAQMSTAASVREDAYRAAGWWPGGTLVARYEQLVADGPDCHAVRDVHGPWISRRQLWTEAGRIADAMTSRGVVTGDIVIVCLPNRAVWQSVFLACLRVGAVPATLPVTSDAATVRYVTKLVGARMVAAPAWHHSRDFRSELLGRENVDGVAPIVLLLDDADEQTWLRSSSSEPVRPEPIPGLAHLMFTSSTTGMPKAVAHTEDTLAAVNIAFAERFSIDGTRPIFMASPLGHSVGAWHGGRLSLFTGAPLVLQENWDPTAALQIVEDEQCVFTAAATPFLKDLVDVEWDGPKLASMRAFLCGGAPVPPALLEAATEQFPSTFVTVLWGMTEGGVTTCLPTDPPLRVTSSAGVGLPGLELRTLADDLSPNPPDVQGELAMRGPGVFVGYYGNDDLYRDQMTDDGFFRTGDLAELDAEGYLRITGRLKDLIIRGGVNISPIPLENALSAHPNIERVAVIGTPDERMGERICAVIVPNGAPPSLADLLSWLEERGLSRRLWPEQVVIVKDMPQTAAGKIRKPILRASVLETLS